MGGSEQWWQRHAETLFRLAMGAGVANLTRLAASDLSHSTLAAAAVLLAFGSLWALLTLRAPTRSVSNAQSSHSAHRTPPAARRLLTCCRRWADYAAPIPALVVTVPPMATSWPECMSGHLVIACSCLVDVLAAEVERDYLSKAVALEVARSLLHDAPVRLNGLWGLKRYGGQLAALGSGSDGLVDVSKRGVGGVAAHGPEHGGDGGAKRVLAPVVLVDIGPDHVPIAIVVGQDLTPGSGDGRLFSCGGLSVCRGRGSPGTRRA